ncbi:hypothetical protein ANO11243_052970 [Dothideomycetidae sp. 11243]|nr:hypothetical protein ANO11243_052970 [fungal sp. No.11243]
MSPSFRLSSGSNNSSPSSSRSNSFTEAGDRKSVRGLTIELIPNQAICRETFIGHSRMPISPMYTPVDEEPPRPRTPTNNLSCAACNALTASPIGRRTATTPAYKRYAVIMPVRHAGPFCRMPPPPTGHLPALPSIGEDCLVEWERKGSYAIAMNLPSPACTPMDGPIESDYFGASASALPAPASRFSTDTVDLLPTGAVPSPRLRATPSSNRSNGRPGTPSSPSREHRSFLRGL